MANLYTMTTIKSYEPYVNNCVQVLLEQFDRFAAKGEWFDLQHFTQCYVRTILLSRIPELHVLECLTIYHLRSVSGD